MAAQVELQAVITAKDEASATLNGLSGTLKANREGLLAVGAAAGVAFAGIAGFAKSAIDSANESAKVQAQLNAVLTSTHGAAGLYIEDLNDQAQALQKMTTYSDEAVGSAQAMLLTFTNVKGGIFQESIGTILDMSTALGQDLKSSAIQVGKALNDPITGVSALRKVGVTFTQDQQDVIKSLVDTGQTAQAQQVILDELAKEFGGSATAQAKTFAGQQQILANQLDDVKETIGNALIPVLTQMLQAVVPIVEKVGEWIQAHPELTKWIIIIAGAVTGLVTVLTALAFVLPTLIAGFTLLTGPIGLVIAAITLLVIAGVALMANWDKVKSYFADVWLGIKTTFKENIDAIISFFQPLIDVVNTVVDKVKGIGSAIGGFVGGAASAVGNAVHAIIPHAMGGSVSPLNTYLVGENGPELFRPSLAGSIVPNGGFGGGGNISISITGTFLSEDAAEKMGDLMVRQLQRKARIGL